MEGRKRRRLTVETELDRIAGDLRESGDDEGRLIQLSGTLVEVGERRGWIVDDEMLLYAEKYFALVRDVLVTMRKVRPLAVKANVERLICVGRSVLAALDSDGATSVQGRRVREMIEFALVYVVQMFADLKQLDFLVSVYVRLLSGALAAVDGAALFVCEERAFEHAFGALAPQQSTDICTIIANALDGLVAETFDSSDNAVSSVNALRIARLFAVLAGAVQPLKCDRSALILVAKCAELRERIATACRSASAVQLAFWPHTYAILGQAIAFVLAVKLRYAPEKLGVQEREVLATFWDEFPFESKGCAALEAFARLLLVDEDAPPRKREKVLKWLGRGLEPLGMHVCRRRGDVGLAPSDTGDECLSDFCVRAQLWALLLRRFWPAVASSLLASKPQAIANGIVRSVFRVDVETNVIEWTRHADSILECTFDDELFWEHACGLETSLVFALVEVVEDCLRAAFANGREISMWLEQFRKVTDEGDTKKRWKIFLRVSTKLLAHSAHIASEKYRLVDDKAFAILVKVVQLFARVPLFGAAETRGDAGHWLAYGVVLTLSAMVHETCFTARADFVALLHPVYALLERLLVYAPDVAKEVSLTVDSLDWIIAPVRRSLRSVGDEELVRSLERASILCFTSVFERMSTMQRSSVLVRCCSEWTVFADEEVKDDVASSWRFYTDLLAAVLMVLTNEQRAELPEGFDEFAKLIDGAHRRVFSTEWCKATENEKDATFFVDSLKCVFPLVGLVNRSAMPADELSFRQHLERVDVVRLAANEHVLRTLALSALHGDASERLATVVHFVVDATLRFKNVLQSSPTVDSGSVFHMLLNVVRGLPWNTRECAPRELVVLATLCEPLSRLLADLVARNEAGTVLESWSNTLNLLSWSAADDASKVGTLLALSELCKAWRAVDEAADVDDEAKMRHEVRRGLGQLMSNAFAHMPELFGASAHLLRAAPRVLSDALTLIAFVLRTELVQPVTPHLVGLALSFAGGIPLLVLCGDERLAPTNRRAFVLVFHAVYDVLNVCMLKHASKVFGMIPSYLAVFSRLLKALVAVGRQPQHDDADLVGCAEQLSRLCLLIGHHTTEFGKVAPYVVATFVECVVESASVLALPVRDALTPGIYRMMDVCDRYGFAMLHSNLRPGMREVFASMFEEYTKFYKYSGFV